MSRQLWRTALTIIACALCMLPLTTHAQSNPDFQHFNAQALLVMDAETGELLHGESETKQLPVYSVSKLMTTYLTLEAIEAGKLNWQQTVKIDETLAAISEVYAFTNVPLTAGESYTIQDLFQAMLVQSANAATMALAQTLSGSEVKFVSLMNDVSAEIGLKNSHFVSSSGLETSDLEPFGLKIAEGGNQMSAVDVAILVRLIYEQFPETAMVTQQAQIWFNEQNETEKFLMTTSNPLLPGASQALPGFLGGKSGFGGLDGTAAYTAMMTTDERTLISVVIGAHNMVDVYEATRQLMEYGLTTEKSTTILMSTTRKEKEGETLFYEFNVLNGTEKAVKIDFYPLIPKAFRDGTKYNYSFTPTATNFIPSKHAYEAPIAANQILGKLIIKDEEGQFVNKITVKAEEAIRAESLDWFQKLIKIIIQNF